jgi:hypothetical protein
MTPLPRAAHLETVVAEHPEVDCYAWLRDTVAEAISAGRFRPGLDDADMISQAFWAGLHGIVSLHIVMKRAPTIPWRSVVPTAEVVISALFEGLVVSGAR